MRIRFARSLSYNLLPASVRYVACHPAQQRDIFVDVDNAEAAAVRIRRCEVKVLPGVGHFLHIEEPEIMQIYREFFDRWDES